VLANLTNKSNPSSSSGRATKKARIAVETVQPASTSSSSTSSRRRTSSREYSSRTAGTQSSSTSSASTETPLVHACDIADRNKLQMVTEYVNDLYAYYKEIEAAKSPTLYMANQEDINSRMRAILIDWLVEVHLKFKLAPVTLHICVALIDMYCSQNAVPRSKLQLVGVTALLIACKYEEIYPPEVRDCVFITDNAYPREEVLEMEMKMLIFFGYNVACSTSHHFLVRFLRISGFVMNSRISHRATYYTERCLQEHDMLAHKPSLIAASAIYLAAKTDRDDSCWHASLKDYCGYTLDEVVPCARRMSEHVNKNPVTASRRPLHAVKRKFENPKFQSVSEEATPIL
jgi:cyclin B